MARRGAIERLRAAAALVPVICAACSDGGGASSGRAAGSSLLLVVFDALSAGHVTHLGYERATTPELDELASEGVTFEQAFAPAPYTVASIPSLLTGRLPDVHGVVDKGGMLRAEEVLLAEILRDAGYATHAAISNPNGSSMIGAEQGFDEYIEMYRKKGERERIGLELEPPAERDLVAERAEQKSFRLPKAQHFLKVVEHWIEERDPERPFFWYVHLLEPHAPYQPPEPFRSRWIDPAYDGVLAEGDSASLLATLDGELPVDEHDHAASRALYDANLAFGDHVFGQILELVEGAGLADDLLIVVTSDHGEAFWEHGRWGHNDQLFEESVRVPLIVRFPDGKGPRGLVVSELASIVDVVPSVIDWLAVPAPRRALSGVTLEPTLERPGTHAGRELVLRSNAEPPKLGLRASDAKAILGPDGAGGERIDHYDLVADPGEHAPIDVDGVDGDGERSDREERLRVLRLRGTASAASSEGSGENAELLRALGYVDD